MRLYNESRSPREQVATTRPEREGEGERERKSVNVGGKKEESWRGQEADRRERERKGRIEEEQDAAGSF